MNIKTRGLRGEGLHECEKKGLGIWASEDKGRGRIPAKVGEKISNGDRLHPPVQQLCYFINRYFFSIRMDGKKERLAKGSPPFAK